MKSGDRNKQPLFHELLSKLLEGVYVGEHYSQGLSKGILQQQFPL